MLENQAALDILPSRGGVVVPASGVHESEAADKNRTLALAEQREALQTAANGASAASLEDREKDVEGGMDTFSLLGRPRGGGSGRVFASDGATRSKTAPAPSANVRAKPAGNSSTTASNETKREVEAKPQSSKPKKSFISCCIQ